MIEEKTAERKKKVHSSYSDGKLSPALLENLLVWRGAARTEVVTGPGIGEDAALIRWKEGDYLVAASDPIVGARKGAGHLLVAVNANDIACKGGDPRYLLVTLIVPHTQGMAKAQSLMEEIDESCRKIGIAIVGGHTELTSRYDHPVIVGTMFGPSRFNYNADQVRSNDVIIMTKHAGLEGMSILAGDRPKLLSFLTGSELEEVKEWKDDLSVVPEATLIRDLAIFMHDPTEGGLIGGLAELSHLCGRDIQIDKTEIRLSDLTREAARKLDFDPLHLISSGVLLAVLPNRYAKEALKRLTKAGIPAAVIGKIGERYYSDDYYRISYDNSSGEAADAREETLNREEPFTEELWRLLELDDAKD